MTLPIHERFYSFQGEGSHSGRAAFFIRTFGCPVHCPWCDSAGTWHPDYIPKQINRMSAEALCAEAKETAADFAVITGGEPAIHDLSELTDALHAAGLKTHIETSGTFPIKGDFDWITLSPKRWRLPLAENVIQANEIKVIIDREESIEEYMQDLAEKGFTHRPEVPVWLHPEWSQHQNPVILKKIIQTIKSYGNPYRAGWQMHKNYTADLEDPRSAQAVPLGGDPSISASVT
ncbi:MAG: 7-carboxy-7-deazaguanine synthase QueE [Verrucomicrobiota bacterium]